MKKLNQYHVTYQNFFEDGARYVHYDIIEAKSSNDAFWVMLDMHSNCRRPLTKDDILNIALWKIGGKNDGNKRCKLQECK